jgi:uncharacterized secreted protein with C-terminal beta-propeller domain
MEELKRKTEASKPPASVGALVAFVLTLFIFAGAMYLWTLGISQSGPQPVPTPTPAYEGEVGELERFDDAEEFNTWMAAADSLAQTWGGVATFATRGMMVEEMAMDAAVPTAAPDGLGLGGGGAQKAERVSETNVQVAGIDEPDILKTDGSEIYYSPEGGYYPIWRGGGGMPEPMPMIEPMMIEDVDFDEDDGEGRAVSVSVDSIDAKMIAPEEWRAPTTKAIMAFPPEDLALDAEIAESGNMLLNNDILAIFGYDGVIAYDVADPTDPQEVWKIKYESNNWPIAQRLKDGELYLVMAGGINRAQPCPFVPLSVSGQEVSIRCGDIWHPVLPVPTDVTYTVLKVDMATGLTLDSASVVGSQSSSVVYMSAGNLYLTHQYPPDAFKFISGFLNANADLVPSYVRDRINKVTAYDISEQSKMTELQQALDGWLRNLDEDESLRVNKEMGNRIEEYFRQNRRDIQSTGIVRLDTENLEVQASGAVPGTPLNQFSLDEHNDHLRIATTSGNMGGWFWQFGLGGGESVNDVYVLDSGLQQVGAALDMGLDERIYAVRFLGDKGYVVTFKQIDPFYVLDLSDPRNPEIKGELKIPGFSSYLHPISDDMILGIGREENQVKLSLFDVSNPSAPTERAKFQLDEYWSDIQNTHHAFLLDDKFEVFFLPGGEGGYIFSYADDNLELVKAVSGLRARRALFLDDYLYVAGDAGIVVLDESDWSRTAELDFE